MSDAPRPSGIDHQAARALLDQARQVRGRAYAPYSRFTVGAALLAADGRVFTGVNVENVAYPIGVCAERIAVGKAISEGSGDFVAIAVVGPDDEAPCTPCGGCRQFLHEFGPALAVIMPRGKELWITTVGDLLPGAFDSERLHGGARG